MAQPDLLNSTVVSIHHDGVEVIRNEGGRWVELPESDNESPTTIEFFFDGQLVYQLHGGVVRLNKLPP
jgi:hypothetical protein